MAAIKADERLFNTVDFGEKFAFKVGVVCQIQKRIIIDRPGVVFS